MAIDLYADPEQLENTRQGDLREPVTAAAISAELGISERTVYRDVAALIEAGIPVYGERGVGGGFRLVEGYRAQLSGLAAPEAQVLLSVGAPGLARQLGLGSILADAQRKVMTALSAQAGAGADRPRFHLDLAGWGQQDRTAPPFLADLARALLDGTRIAFSYQRVETQQTKDWAVDPLGLVLKSGAWYLVAQPVGRDAPLIFRAPRIATAKVLADRTLAPDGVDLASFWESQSRAYEGTFESVLVTVRLPLNLHWRVSAQQVGSEGPKGSGMVVVDLDVEGIDDAVSYLLQLGGDLEVLGPAEVRGAVSRQVARLADLYRAEGDLGRGAPKSTPS